MATQLTADLEKRIQAVVASGAYRSAEEALDAAVAAIEGAAAPGFEGAPEELVHLLEEGLESGGAVPVDADFWAKLEAQTDRMIQEYSAKTK